MRRRTFVGLTGASLLGSILDAAPDSGQLDAESSRPCWPGTPPTRPVRPGEPPDIAALAAAVTSASAITRRAGTRR